MTTISEDYQNYYAISQKYERRAKINRFNCLDVNNETYLYKKILE